MAESCSPSSQTASSSCLLLRQILDLPSSVLITPFGRGPSQSQAEILPIMDYLVLSTGDARE